MSDRRFRHFKPGTAIGEQLTILDVVAKVRGRHPVYIAWDHQGWCPVAVKVFRTLEGAHREADVLAAVAHPNVVRPLGVQKPALLLMEFLEGPTLEADLLERPDDRLSVSDALRTAIHLGAALQRVHAAGYLHLDVKPGNVIMANGRPILFDFGTARRRDAARPSDSVGTDAYMAPEECACAEATPAADVFSLGVTLFETLAGDMPFQDGTKASPHPQLTEPSRSLRAYRAVAAGLDDLVSRCLSLSPQERPTLDELLPALHAYIRGGPRMWPSSFTPGRRTDPTRSTRKAA